jgi:uncharacterized lipoprotein YmbA
MLAALLVAVLAGCAASSPRTEFYTLDSAPPASSGASRARVDEPALRVSVWQVVVPDMVNRSQLVVRTAPNRVDIADSHRWAEPLRIGIARVLADDLALELGSGFVVVHGQPAGFQPELRVFFDVQKFEAVLGEGVTVEALWNVRPARGETRGGEAKSGRSVAEERAGAAGYAPLVAAYSRALARIAHEVAQSLR